MAAFARPSRGWLAGLLGSVLALTLADDARAEEAANSEAASPLAAAGGWALTQLLPSPLLVTGKDHVGGGLRWQVTPLLFSFGIAERPWRTFLVAPMARQSGSIELHVSPEWACCAPGSHGSWLLRTGLRAYFPLAERGELLSCSIGGSYFRGAGRGGFAGDLGIYTLSGIFGLNVTVSPGLERRQMVSALTVRYF